MLLVDVVTMALSAGIDLYIHKKLVFMYILRIIQLFINLGG